MRSRLGLGEAASIIARRRCPPIPQPAVPAPTHDDSLVRELRPPESPTLLQEAPCRDRPGALDVVVERAEAVAVGSSSRPAFALAKPPTGAGPRPAP